MKNLLLSLLLLFMAVPAFAQPVKAESNVSYTYGQRYGAWSADLGVSDRAGFTVYKFGTGQYEGFVNYNVASADVNPKSVLRVNTLVGYGTDGMIGGVMVGETHEDFYWNVIAGNIYRAAGGVTIPQLDHRFTINGAYGKRGYGGSLDCKLSKGLVVNAWQPKLTVGWGDSQRFYIGLKLLLGWSN